MPFPPVRCCRSLSCSLLCRLFPFGQLLCLFDRSLHSENACLLSRLRTWLAPAGYFYYLRSKKYPASRERFTALLSAFSKPTKIHSLPIFVLACEATGCVTIFASQSQAY